MATGRAMGANQPRSDLRWQCDSSGPDAPELRSFPAWANHITTVAFDVRQIVTAEDCAASPRRESLSFLMSACTDGQDHWLPRFRSHL
jgi:hypothetical protein